jgi:integrase
MKKTLSAKTIESLKPATTRRYEVWDTLLPGFGVRVTVNGRKTWFAVGRVDGRQVRHTIGTHPTIALGEARETARGILRDMQLGQYAGKQVEATDEPEAITFGIATDEFIQRYAKPKNRTWKAAEADLRKFTGLMNKPLGEVTRADIVRELDHIALRAPVGVNRALSQIKKLYAWALDRGMVDVHPALGLKKPAKETSRDRLLTDAEIISFWTVTGEMGFPFGPLLRLLLLTGQRRGEVSAMRWSQLDLDRGIWKIPASLAKNGRAHEVPLSSTALNILRTLPQFEGSDFVFTTTGRTPVSGFGRVKDRLDKVGELSAWVVHDLRRTAASGMARLGVAPHVIEKVLNHVSGTISGVAAVYNRHGYEAEKRQALEIWAEWLEGLTQTDSEQDGSNSTASALAEGCRQSPGAHAVRIGMAGDLPGAANSPYFRDAKQGKRCSAPRLCQA